MFTILIAITIGIAIGLAICLRSRSDWWLGVIAGFVLGTVVGLITAAIFTDTAPDVCVYSGEDQLVSLRDDLTIKGSFFLATGNINNQLQYIYFTKGSDGGITSHMTPNGVTYEDEKDSPKVVYWTLTVDPSWQRFVLGTPDEVCPNQFHVPPGSVDRGYKVG